MKFTVIFAACLAAPCLAQELKPDTLIQEQLGKVVSALSQSRGPQHLNAAAIQELNALNELVADKNEIVKQVAIFATGPDEQRPLMALAIMDLLELPPKIVIPVLAPHLNADEPKLRSFVRDWFQGHDKGGLGNDSLKPVNFEDYVDYVRGMVNRKQEVPASFVEYIYGRSPGQALIVFSRALGERDAAVTALQAEAKEVEAARDERDNPGAPVLRKPAKPAHDSNRGIPLSERIISHAVALKNWDNGKLLPEAKEHLAKLAENEAWWARLYVAEIMRWHPELRQADVLEQLGGDEHALVSKAAKAAGG